MLSGFHRRAVFTSSSHQSRLSSLTFHLSFSFHLPPPFPLISSASLQRFPFVSFAFPSLLFCLILSLCLHVKQPGVCLVFSETKLTAGNPLKFVWAKCRTRLLCYFEIWGWRAGIWSDNPREATLFSAEPSSLRGSLLGRFGTISSWWWWWWWWLVCWYHCSEVLGTDWLYRFPLDCKGWFSTCCHDCNSWVRIDCFKLFRKHKGSPVEFVFFDIFSFFVLYDSMGPSICWRLRPARLRNPGSRACLMAALSHLTVWATLAVINQLSNQ